MLKRYHEPVVALIRHPYDYIMSRWAYNKRSEERWRNASWDHWFRWFHPDLDQNDWGDRIAMYHEFVDYYYLYEDGLDDFFYHVGVNPTWVPHVGEVDTSAWRIPVWEMEPKWRRDINKRFAADMQLYREVAKRGPVDIPINSHYNNSE